MSDEEEVYSEEEEEEEEEEVVTKTTTTTTTTTKVEEGAGDPEFIKRQDQKRSDLDDQIRDYITEWRKQRAKEEEDLKKLKEKQAKRKINRAEEEQKMAERKKQEDERRIREMEEKKQRDIEEKRQRLEEAEKKRQAMMQAIKDQNKGPNFTITKRDPSTNISAAQIEKNKTKEQLQEEKRISLSIRIKPLTIDNLSADKLKEKAQELWACIVKLETEKYDLEERQKRQDYDLKELKERQKQQLRHKALKKGLDPEALTGKHPPLIQVASKYERRVDIRSYGDKKKLYEGGYEEFTKETSEKNWQDKFGQFDSRQKAKLPKWFGERPGKKQGDPESPEGEDDGKQAADDDDDIKEPVFEPEPEEEEEEEEEEVEEEEEEEDEEEEE